MNKQIGFLFIVAVASGAAVPQRSNKMGLMESPHRSPRLIGGIEIPIEDAPYIVQIEDSGQYRVAGVLANKNHIITIAFSFEDLKTDNLQVRAGSSTLSSQGTVHNVTNIKLHTNYTFDLYNIAIFTVEPEFKFDSSLHPIILADEEPVDGALGTVSGFGATSNDDYHLSSELRSVNVSVVARESCELFSSETEFCGGNEEGGPCHGDLGAPIVVDGKVAGVLGYEQCGRGGFNTFTSIALVKDWIEKNI